MGELTVPPRACTIKTLRIRNLQIQLYAGVFQANVFVTDNKKDTSLKQNVDIYRKLRVCCIL